MSINSGGSMWAWTNVKTISMLTIGIVMLLVFIIIEAFFAKIPIIPLRLFKQRSPSVLIVTGFLHDFAWQSTQYFVPLYYQTVRGFSPLQSATLIVPFLLAQGIAGAASGPLMAKYARWVLLESEMMDWHTDATKIHAHLTSWIHNLDSWCWSQTSVWSEYAYFNLRWSPRCRRSGNRMGSPTR
jgi:hypothetical protein